MKPVSDEHRDSDKHRVYFLFSGLFCICIAILLFGAMAYTVMHFVAIPNPYGGSGHLTPRNSYELYGILIRFGCGPLVCLIAAIVCIVIGIKLLRAVGIATPEVIPAQDFPILAKAIGDANEDAISQYVRLSSLSGITGTFTKVGLTGLPLATIFLTVFFALFGLFNAQFYDLAKLTLGAFIGSFVQRPSDNLIKGSSAPEKLVESVLRSSSSRDVFLSKNAGRLPPKKAGRS